MTLRKLVQESAMLRLIIPWLAGIYGGLSCNSTGFEKWAVVILLIGVLFGLLLATLKKKMPGIIFFILTVCSGFYVGQTANVGNPDHLTKGFHSDRAFIGRILEIKKGSKWHRLVVRAKAVNNGSIWAKKTGKYLLYMPVGKENQQQLQPADRIMGTARFYPVPGPKNPHAFDPKRYWKSQGVHYQAFLDTNSYKIIPPGRGLHLDRLFSHLRQVLSAELSASLPDIDRNAVGHALLMGDRSLLHSGLKKAFTESGSMHVLAVSGLHVGFVSLLLNFLFTRLHPYLGRHPWIETPLIIACIWAYALLCGGRASVLRAATMFSFLQLAIISARKTHVLTVLVLSAILLLLIQPAALLAPGFQLSYLAVIHIVLWYPLIREKMGFTESRFRYVFDLLCLSFCAQLGTFPVSVYYFNQFPVYFAPAGLLVVPLSTLIISTGMLFFLTSPLSVLQDIVAWILNLFLECMIRSVGYFSGLDGSLLDAIWLSIPGIFGLYGIIWVFYEFLLTKRKLLLFALLLCIAILIVHWYAIQEKQQEQYQLTIYHHPEQVILDVFSGEKCLQISEHAPEKEDVRYMLSPNRTHAGIKQVEHLTFRDTAFFKEFLLGRSVVATGDELFTAEPVSDRSLVLKETPIHVIYHTPDFIQPPDSSLSMILHPSLPNKKRYWLRKTAKRQQQPYYDIEQSGAFVKNWH